MAQHPIRQLLDNFDPATFANYFSERDIEPIAGLVEFRAWSDQDYIPDLVRLLSTNTLYFRDDGSTEADDGNDTIWTSVTIAGRRLRYSRWGIVGSGGGSGAAYRGPTWNYVEQGITEAVDIRTQTADMVFIGLENATASIILPNPGMGGRAADAPRPRSIILVSSIACTVSLTVQGSDTIHRFDSAGVASTGTTLTINMPAGSQHVLNPDRAPAAGAVWYQERRDRTFLNAYNLTNLNERLLKAGTGVNITRSGDELTIDADDAASLLPAVRIDTAAELLALQTGNFAMNSHYVISDEFWTGQTVLDAGVPADAPVGSVLLVSRTGTRTDGNRSLTIDLPVGHILDRQDGTQEVPAQGARLSIVQSNVPTGELLVLVKTGLDRWHFSPQFGTALMTRTGLADMLSGVHGTVKEFNPGLAYAANEQVWVSDGDITAYWRAKRDVPASTVAPEEGLDWEPVGNAANRFVPTRMNMIEVVRGILQPGPGVEIEAEDGVLRLALTLSARIFGDVEIELYNLRALTNVILETVVEPTISVSNPRVYNATNRTSDQAVPRMGINTGDWEDEDRLRLYLIPTTASEYRMGAADHLAIFDGTLADFTSAITGDLATSANVANNVPPTPAPDLGDFILSGRSWAVGTFVYDERSTQIRIGRTSDGEMYAIGIVTNPHTTGTGVFRIQITMGERDTQYSLKDLTRPRLPYWAAGTGYFRGDMVRYQPTSGPDQVFLALTDHTAAAANVPGSTSQPVRWKNISDVDIPGVYEPVKSIITAGQNVSITTDDNAETISIAVLTETIQDIVGSLLRAGTGATVAYNDTAGTITIGATGGGGGGLTQEQVQDIVGGLVVGGDNVTVSYDDAGNRLVINAVQRGGPTQAEVYTQLTAGAITAGNNITLARSGANSQLTINAANTQRTDEEIEDVVGGLITDGTNTTVTYDDANGTLTVDFSNEVIQDIVGAMFSDGTGTTAVYDDAAGTLQVNRNTLTAADVYAAVVAVLQAGNNITLTADPANNQINIGASGVGGGGLGSVLTLSNMRNLDVVKEVVTTPFRGIGSTLNSSSNSWETDNSGLPRDVIFSETGSRSAIITFPESGSGEVRGRNIGPTTQVRIYLEFTGPFSIPDDLGTRTPFITTTVGALQALTRPSSPASFADYSSSQYVSGDGQIDNIQDGRGPVSVTLYAVNLEGDPDDDFVIGLYAVSSRIHNFNGLNTYIIIGPVSDVTTYENALVARPDVDETITGVADDDLISVTDVSDTSGNTFGTTKNITTQNLIGSLVGRSDWIEQTLTIGSVTQDSDDYRRLRTIGVDIGASGKGSVLIAYGGRVIEVPYNLLRALPVKAANDTLTWPTAGDLAHTPEARSNCYAFNWDTLGGSSGGNVDFNNYAAYIGLTAANEVLLTASYTEKLLNTSLISGRQQLGISIGNLQNRDELARSAGSRQLKVYLKV